MDHSLGEKKVDVGATDFTRVSELSASKTAATGARGHEHPQNRDPY